MRRSLSLRALAALAVVSAVLPGVASPASAERARSVSQEDHGYPDYDVRYGLDSQVSPTQAQKRAFDLLAPARVHFDALHGTPSTIVSHGRFLTGRSDQDPATIARGWLRDNSAAYRLTPFDLDTFRLRKTYRSRHNGVGHVFFDQRIDGREIHGSSLSFTIDGMGRIAITGGPVFATLAVSPVATEGPADAVMAAAGTIGASSTGPLEVRIAGDAPARKTVFENTFAPELAAPAPVTTELVVFPMSAGHGMLAWKTIVEVDGENYYEIVTDAVKGELLFRRSYYSHSGAHGDVFTNQHPDAGTQQQNVSFGPTGSSPLGYVTARRTAGNNVTAYQDLDNSNAVGYQPETPNVPSPNYQHFDYAFGDAWRTSNGTDLTTDRDSSITQLFYYVNRVHDFLYPLGFDEPAGNFQVTNFRPGGAGNDPVLAEAQDGYGTGTETNCTSNGAPSLCRNNANFSYSEDGTSSRMQMYLWTPNRPYRDGAFDGDVIAHEYGHGLAFRLVGGGSYGSGRELGSMGEGWSDVLSMYMWNDSLVGEYVTGDTTTGIRGVDYGTSTLTYADYNFVTDSCEVHCNGQIWASTLYEMQQKLIDRYGNATGQAEADQLLVDSLKATPDSANFLTARDAYLAADTTTNSGDNHCMIWRVFANRGMGLSAASSNNMSTATAATDGPATCIPNASIGGPYSTSEGTDIALNASGSTQSSNASGGPLSYAWDLDDDGEFDDATGATPTFDRVGRDGAFPISVRATNRAGWSDEDSATVTVGNVAPSVSLDAVSPADEGSLVTLTGSITDPGWLDPLTATIDWKDGSGAEALSGTLESERPNASLSFSPTHTYGDNGTYAVEVCASDDDASGICRDVDVQISNVAPDVSGDPNQIKTIAEGEFVSARSTFSDPGWLDTYSSMVDWGTGDTEAGTLSVTSEGPPADLGEVTASHQYGDNGTFDVTTSVTDDDGGVGSDGFAVTVTNVDPTAVIDLAGTTPLNGGNAVFLAHEGEPIDFKGNSKDPGSDDLTLTWDWDDGAPNPDESTTYLVDPPLPDPPHMFNPAWSPTNESRDQDDEKTHSFVDACVYEITFGAEDDDEGRGHDNANVVIVGNQTKDRSQGNWQHQYRRNGNTDFTNEELNCFLEITGFVSDVFDEARDASTIAAAHDVLFMAQNGGSASQKLDRSLITALLNFAQGSTEWSETVSGLAFGDAVAQAEAVRLNPAATDAQLHEQKKVLDRYTK